ncbi:MAG: hypothetical protein KDN19_09180 [Verrucomicrobiae bacterium]|nr:hypothetical protein [Verrucomicrobiae bacterium]
MAGLKNADNFAKGETFNAGLLKWVLLMVGGGAAVLFFIIYAATGGGDDPSVFHRGMAYSWLFGVTYFLTLAVGGIFWTLLHNATNSGWGTVVRRLMENLGSVVIVMFALSLPLLFGGFRDALWEWFPIRATVLEEAKSHAEHELNDYRAELSVRIEAATKRLNEIKKENEAAMATASDNQKLYLKSEITAAQAKLNEVKAEEGSDEAMKAHLADEHFKHANTGLYKKRGYLNEGFWYIRFVFYVIALFSIIFVLRGWSIKQDQSGDPKYFRRMRRAACGFLPLFATAWTFLVFDWLMGLDYTWFSTMWGVYLFAGAALNSMAFLIILLTVLRRAGYLKEVITMEHYHLMGKLLLAFTIFWAYIAFSQFFLIWYANITEETKFYLTRNTAYWNTHAILFLVIGHFFVPFAILLIQGLKKNPMLLSAVAAWSLVMHFCDIYWIIIPERGPSLTNGEEMFVLGNFFTDILAWVAVAGIFGFGIMHFLGKGSLYPCRDPRLDESLNVVN